MRKAIYILLPIFILYSYSCTSVPKNFTYLHENKDTGLDSLIDINGYYISQHGCDSTFYSVFMFYSNGLFTIATTSKLLTELTDCFEKGGNSTICKYPLWGTFCIEGNIIKTQVIRAEGGGCIIFRDYMILPDRQIQNISDYVEPQYTTMGYMQNYPSFRENACPTSAKFYPSETKRDSTECPFLKKKWFNK